MIPKRFASVKSILLSCGYLCTCLIEWKKLLEKNGITNVCFGCYQVNTVIGWWKHQNTIKRCLQCLKEEFTWQSATKGHFFFFFLTSSVTMQERNLGTIVFIKQCTWLPRVRQSLTLLLNICIYHTRLITQNVRGGIHNQYNMYLQMIKRRIAY